MTFSEEVRQGYLNHVCDELPTDEWADRIAELEEQRDRLQVYKDGFDALWDVVGKINMVRPKKTRDGG